MTPRTASPPRSPCSPQRPDFEDRRADRVLRRATALGVELAADHQRRERRASSSPVSTVATSRRSRRTVTRSETAFTSWSLCEMKTSVGPRQPSRAGSRTGRRPPAVSAPPWARPGSGSAPGDRAPSGSRRAAARRRRTARFAPRVDGIRYRPPSSATRRSIWRGWTRTSCPTLLVAEHHVLGHRERLDEPDVLVHHADPRGDRVARALERDRAP